MKKRYKLIIGIVAVVVVCLYSAISYLSPLAVSGEQVSAGEIIDTFTAQGQVLPKQSVLLNATATGTITDLPFKPGMTVKQGQALMSVDAASQAELAIQKEQLRQQLAASEHQYRQLFGAQGQAQQRAAVDAAQSAYNLAEQQYQAALSVEREMGGVYTEAELAELATAVKTARQALTAAQAQGTASTDRDYYLTLQDSMRLQLEALEEEQQNEPLLAPFDGVVWQLLAEQGAYIIKRQPVLKFYQQGQMKVEVSLLSQDSLNIREGDTAQLLWGSGESCAASVSFISPVAEQVVSGLGIMENRCTVELEPQDLPPELGAGYQLDVVFNTVLAEQALSVAATSIVPLDMGSGVYVADKGKARLTPVTTGIKSGGRVEILSGLQSGDFIIANPYDAGVKDGSRVKAVNN